MSKWTTVSSKTLLLLIIVVILLAYFSLQKGSDIFRKETNLENKYQTFASDSTALEKTVILPTLNTPIIPGKNNIWCSSFQLTWNEMKDNLIKERILVTGAEDVSKRLNSTNQKKNDLSEDSYYIATGKVSDGIINKIQTDMARRFPYVQMPEFNPSDALIAYSYLETYIKFKKAYRQYDKALLFIDSSGNQTPVSSFGVWKGYLRQYRPLCRQIEILYCKFDKNHNIIEFALDLSKDSKPYQIVLSITEPKESLELTYNTLQTNITEFKNNHVNDYHAKFDKADILEVPDMFWQITHHFTELENKSLSNLNYQNMPISTAMQIINFRLDRSGVILKSESMIGVAAISKKFILNKPFLIYLKSRDAQQPFFVMWVDNAELLTPFSKVNFRSLFNPISIQQGLLRENGFLHNSDKYSANV